MNFIEKYIAFKTIFRREVTRFMRIWSQTLLPPVITQSLYFLIFGKFIGSQIRDVDGVSYMAFILPGLVMMAIINSSFSNVVSSFFSSKFQRSIEEVMVSPTPDWILVSGYVAGGMLRGMMVGSIVLGVTAFFVKPAICHPVIIFAFAVLTSVIFCLGGLLNGILAKSFDDVSIFQTFILTPLTYLGGVFYSIAEFDDIWRILSQFNPILYMVNGFRYGMYGFSDVSLWASFLICAIFTVILAGINLLLLKKGIGLKV